MFPCYLALNHAGNVAMKNAEVILTAGAYSRGIAAWQHAWRRSCGYDEAGLQRKDLRHPFAPTIDPQGKTVTHETVGNLSHLPDHVIDLIRRSLKGESFVPAGQALRITRSTPTAMSRPS